MDRLSSAKTEPAESPRGGPDAGKDDLPRRPIDWLIWQWIDSAFPTGGFAHSSGLEAAWQQGEIGQREDVVLFVEASLEQCGHAALPFVGAAFDSPVEFLPIDSLCDVFLTNHVANRASRAQGRAFLNAAERLFPFVVKKLKSEAVYAHLPPVWGACLRGLEVKRETAIRMFFFNHLRCILAAAVRLNILGPMEAQIMQQRTSETAEDVIKKCEMLGLGDIAQTVPLLELWQGAQNRLYSRLFQS
jgi:urease accessory protein